MLKAQALFRIPPLFGILGSCDLGFCKLVSDPDLAGMSVTVSWAIYQVSRDQALKAHGSAKETYQYISVCNHSGSELGHRVEWFDLMLNQVTAAECL